MLKIDLRNVAFQVDRFGFHLALEIGQQPTGNLGAPHIARPSCGQPGFGGELLVRCISEGTGCNTRSKSTESAPLTY
jgi:hypothetical protein